MGLASAAWHPARADVSFDSVMFALVNQDRASFGLAPLAWFGDLGTIAEDGPYTGCGFPISGRAVDMGVRNYFAHTILNCGTRNVFDMMQARLIPYRSAGENIGAEFGASDATAAANQINDAFMAEPYPVPAGQPPNHKSNILSTTFTHVGVGSWHTPPGQSWTGTGAAWTNAYVAAEDFAALPAGTTGPPAARVEPGSVAFGTQAIGSTSAPVAINLLSSGTAGLAIGTTRLAGPAATDFSIASDGCSDRSLAAGGSCTVSVTFTPHAAGARTATLQLNDDAAGSPQEVALAGNDGGMVAVMSISPPSGSTAGGAIVSVSGANLTGATAVTFGSIPAQAFSVLDSGTIQASTPRGTAGIVDVRVTTPAGVSAVSGADRFTYVVASAGSYGALQPTRICDTRPASATYGIAVNQCNSGGAGASLGPGQSMDVSVCDGFGGPSACDLGAVTMNLAVADGTMPSYVTAYPAGAGLPLSSSINFLPGDIKANLVDVRVGSQGKVTVYNAQGTVDVILDLEGTAPASGAASATSPGLYHAVPPARVCDTRAANPTYGIAANPCDAAGAGAVIGPGGTMNVQMTGQGGIPTTGVAAVVFNLTVTDTVGGSYMTAWPASNARSVAANINWPSGSTIPNRVVVPVGHDGQVSLFNAVGSTDVVIDVSGWFGDGTEGPPTGAVFTGVVPVRICDTRATNPTYGIVTNQCNNGGAGAPLDQSPRTVQVTGAGLPVPAGAVAVVANVTVTNTSAPSYLTVWPSDVASRPLAADLNWTAGQTAGNLVVVKLSAGGAVNAFNAAGKADVVIDVVGYHR